MAPRTSAVEAQARLIASVGSVAPQIVGRDVTVRHGALLLAAAVTARSKIAPLELPVGILTAVVGGVYLLVLLRRQHR